MYFLFLTHVCGPPAFPGQAKPSALLCGYLYTGAASWGHSSSEGGGGGRKKEGSFSGSQHQLRLVSLCLGDTLSHRKGDNLAPSACVEDRGRQGLCTCIGNEYLKYLTSELKTMMSASVLCVNRSTSWSRSMGVAAVRNYHLQA